jgi:Cupin-like domain
MGPASDSRPASNSRKRTRYIPVEVTSDDFSELQAPHPYGVLPSGNRYFCTDVVESSITTGFNAADILNEECWNTVLSCLDGAALAVVAQTCRFLYVATHQPELWRDLMLLKTRKSTITTVGPSWKDTYVLTQHNVHNNYRPHVPMQVRGVYSDYYYRLHSCRSFALPQTWLNGDDPERNSVPKVPVDDMTTELFLEKFEQPNQPVLIQGAASGWQACRKWQDPAYCEQLTASQTFRATSGVAQHPAIFTWKSYRAYCVVADSVESTRLLEEGPLYLFDRTALKPNSVLWKDFMYDLQKTCPYWDPERKDEIGGHDLFGILGEGRRPDHTWLIVGPKRSGSVFHIDPNGTHAWNAAICGRKRWIFYPPGVTPPGVHPSDDGDEVALPLSIGEWLFQFWDEHCRRKKSAPLHERPLECTAMPGDVLFVPHGWWHMVINLDDMNIAITHNYVSVSNLSNVLKFLDTKRDQVSGCRDRAESIKPERLYEEFVQAMEQHHHDWLQTALAVPDWTCRTWKLSCLSNHRVENTQSGGAVTNKPSLSKTSVMEKAKSGIDTSFSFSFV